MVVEATSLFAVKSFQFDKDGNYVDCPVDHVDACSFKVYGPGITPWRAPQYPSYALAEASLFRLEDVFAAGKAAAKKELRDWIGAIRR